ncbi:class I SAM-dependent methyltransferase [uncultured Brevundimonas sp.]|uniref:SAM-dependent methyltransferase n=1 Tax=uncultured Brevundimonas sp. TaxID=213418 RepID=UPI0025951D13|nr:class I SAM-dependent methyltransferase [uncultured Brevundimonas sp.]
MSVNFQRVAYATLPVCNALGMADVEAAVSRTGLAPGARALDLGCAHAGVAIHLARRFALDFDAVDADGAMIELARERIDQAGVGDHVTLHHAWSGAFLADQSPYQLIVAIGVIEPVGAGVREPAAMMAGLSRRLTPGGWLLWGDLAWKGEPPAPLRQVIEANNLYADHTGWQAAARDAGLEVVSAGLSDDATWAHYLAAMDAAVRDWTAANPDRPETPAIAARGDQVRSLFAFGRDYLDFGLYLLRRPES